MATLGSLFVLLLAARIMGATVATIHDLNADAQRRLLLAPRRVT